MNKVGLYSRAMNPDETREPELRVVNARGVEVLLDEMAEQIRPHFGPESALIGILRRGKPLATMLAERLSTRFDFKIQVGELMLKRYSDSLELLHHRPHIDTDVLDLDVENRHLILVDDVLYTGETMFRAACAMRSAGAAQIQTAFLCARPGLKMPLHADFVGARFDIRPDWVIHCEIPPYEPELGITLSSHAD